MLRDFTDEAYNNWINEVDGINCFQFQNELIDRLRHAPLVSDLFGGQFSNVFNDLEGYQDLFCKYLLYNKGVIDSIFSDVNDVSLAYRYVFEGIKADVVRQTLFIKGLSDAFSFNDEVSFSNAMEMPKNSIDRIKNDYIDNLYHEYVSGRLTSISDIQLDLIDDLLIDDFIAGRVENPTQEQLTFYDAYLNAERKALQEKYSEWDMPIRQIYQNDRDKEKQLVDLFRCLHPDIAEDLDAFFGSARYNSIPEDEFADDVMNITFIALCAPEAEQKLFFDVLDEIKLGTIDAYERDEYGNIVYDLDGNPKILKSQFFEEVNIINICVAPGRSGLMESPYGPYMGLLHEIGHAVDYNFENGCCYSMLYNEGTNYETIRTDVYNAIENQVTIIVNEHGLQPDGEFLKDIDTLIIDLTESMFSEEVRAGISHKYENYLEKYNIYMDDIIFEIRSAFIGLNMNGELLDGALSIGGYYQNAGILNQYTPDYRFEYPFDESYSIKQWVNYSFSVGDMFCGATNNFIYGADSHKDFGFYWFDAEGNPTGRLEKETAATCFSIFMTGNINSMELMQQYVPDTYETYTQMFDYMAENCSD